MRQYKIDYGVITARNMLKRMNIGAEIRRAREAAGLNQEQLAELCGWQGQARVSHLETGRTRLDFQDMVRIEDALAIKRGTLYARARGDSVDEASDLDKLARLDPEKATMLIMRLVEVIDLDLPGRSELARRLLDPQPTTRRLR
ncbi:MAG: helix-turn-helix transcriptional regulator [Pseudomonadota bacterium]